MEETFETQLFIIMYINLKGKRFFHRREEETFIYFQNNFRYGQSDDMSLTYSVRAFCQMCSSSRNRNWQSRSPVPSFYFVRLAVGKVPILGWDNRGNIK